jgi:hypothetical protein
MTIADAQKRNLWATFDEAAESAKVAAALAEAMKDTTVQERKTGNGERRLMPAHRDDLPLNTPAWRQITSLWWCRRLRIPTPSGFNRIIAVCPWFPGDGTVAPPVAPQRLLDFLSPAAPLSDLMQKVNKSLESYVPSGSFAPKKGELCAAVFALDNSWYRAKVVQATGGDVEVRSPATGSRAMPRSVCASEHGGMAQVLFVDYGNTETVPKADLAPLPAGCNTLPPQATQVKLAFLEPVPADWQEETKR